MQPIQITVRAIPHSYALQEYVRRKAEKLSQFYQRINTCRVIIDQAQRHKHQGKLFKVIIDLRVPGKELVVNRKQSEDVYIAIRDAFEAIYRQLETYIQKHRGDVKHHPEVNKGIVSRILADGYGFIQGTDGMEYYFNAVNVGYPSFNELRTGDTVEFLSVIAQDGLQAHRVSKERHNHLAFEL